jgi:secondary thiamine-phosphate synthase enzyme
MTFEISVATLVAMVVALRGGLCGAQRVLWRARFAREERPMTVALVRKSETASGVAACTDYVELRTNRPFQLIDITELVAERVRRSGVATGLIALQTLHTTAALIVNENEPLLMQDLQLVLERIAPRAAPYAHDDFARRGLEAPCAERMNGHAHCKALFLSPSVALNVEGGRLKLGRWQRLFLVELDGGQRRGIAIVVLGIARPRTTARACDESEAVQ